MIHLSFDFFFATLCVIRKLVCFSGWQLYHYLHATVGMYVVCVNCFYFIYVEYHSLVYSTRIILLY